MTMTLTESIAIALAIGGLTSGLLAAWFWERTTRVRVDHLGSNAYATVPLGGDISDPLWWTAKYRPNQQIGRLNARAAAWTAAAVVFSTQSSVVGLF